MVWHHNHSSKMALCLLRAIHSKLLTWGFLLNLGGSGTIWYVFCASKSCWKHHLLNIWLPILRLHMEFMQSIHEEALLLKNISRKKRKASIMARSVLAAAVWYIWKEKNTKSWFLEACMRDAKEQIRACPWKSDKERQKIEILSNWGIQICNYALYYTYLLGSVYAYNLSNGWRPGSSPHSYSWNAHHSCELSKV